MAADDGPPATDEKRPAGPQDYRRGEHQFEPDGGTVAEPVVHRQSGHRPHRYHQKRQRQRRAEPEPAGEIDQFRIGTFVARRHAHRLQRHPADRAGAGTFLHDFGIHRAGEHRAGGGVRGGFPVSARQIVYRVGGEFVVAALAAEMKYCAVMDMRRLRRGRIDRHTADRIQGFGRRTVCSIQHGMGSLSRPHHRRHTDHIDDVIRNGKVKHCR